MDRRGRTDRLSLTASSAAEQAQPCSLRALRPLPALAPLGAGRGFRVGACVLQGPQPLTPTGRRVSERWSQLPSQRLRPHAPSGRTLGAEAPQLGWLAPTGCVSPQLWVRDITKGAWSPARWEY